MIKRSVQRALLLGCTCLAHGFLAPGGTALAPRALPRLWADAPELPKKKPESKPVLDAMARLVLSLLLDSNN